MRHDERGLTLIELLMALAIISTILIMITGVQLSGQRQFSTQQETIQVQSDIRAALKSMTVQIRSVPEGDVTASGTALTAGDAVYSFDSADNAILLNGAVFASSIARFSAEQNGTELTIRIEDTAGHVQSTVIYNE